MLWKVIAHFLQGPHNQWGGLQKDQSYHWRMCGLPAIVGRPRLQWFGHVSMPSGLAKTILQEWKKEKSTEQEVGRQYCSVDRAGLYQLNESS